MYRILRKGGLLVIIEHNPFNPLTQISVYRCPFDKDAVLLTARNVQLLLKTLSIKPKTEYFLLLAGLHLGHNTAHTV